MGGSHKRAKATYAYITMLLCYIALTGCLSTGLSARKSSVPRNIWTLELREFWWSESPRESIARLESLVRSRARDRSICFIWPSDIDRWVSIPPQTEMANVVSLLYRAASGAGIEVTLLESSAIFTPSSEDVFMPISIIVSVIDADTHLTLEDARFVADVLLPPHVVRLGNGGYVVTIYVPVPIRCLGDIALIRFGDLFSPIMLLVKQHGYLETKVCIRVAGDENTIFQYRVKLQAEPSRSSIGRGEGSRLNIQQCIE